MNSTKIPKKCVGGLLNFVDVIMDAILVAYFFQKKECISSNVEDFVQTSNSSSDAREIRHIDLNYQTYGFIALRKGHILKSGSDFQKLLIKKSDRGYLIQNYPNTVF